MIENLNLSWFGDLQNLLLLLFALVYLLAFVSVLRAIAETRSAQGALAWSIALISMPVITLPIYWVFGRSRFHGYVSRRSQINSLAVRTVGHIGQLAKFAEKPLGQLEDFEKTAQRLSGIGFLGGNNIHLLVEGEQVFESMLADIRRAQRYILIEYYIFRDDEVGQRFVEAFIERAIAGVAVSFLYDPVGCNLSRSFLQRLEKAGIEHSVFDTTRGEGNRFQFNFRNHRKIIVIDGELAFVGGLNIGREYLGKDPRHGAWRDLHVRIEGPGAMMAAVAFIKDWYWARRGIPKMDFKVPTPRGNSRTLIWHTGPADDLPECSLGLLAAFNTAQQRLWIATPYFVPTDAIMLALRMAVLRGVDVRIIVPEKNDKYFVGWASEIYQYEMLRTGAHIYRYKQGFLHSKAFLVDNCLASVGSVNLDNRSILLNFEIVAYSDDRDFIQQLHNVFNEDMTRSHQLTATDAAKRNRWHKFRARCANLMAPLL